MIEKINISKQVKWLMKTYKDYIYFLGNIKFIEAINNIEIEEDEINRRRWYCSYIDELLNSLLPIERQILEQVYMTEKHPSTLHLSLATYYLKRNKLFEKLKNTIFIDNNDFNKIKK